VQTAPSILPLRPFVSAAELEARFPAEASIYACDFYVSGAEAGQIEEGGLRIGRILNVDHHAPLARMHSRVTSTELACRHLTAGARPDPTHRVVINHTDCDSILSSSMLLGHLPADPDLVAASIRADHTGEDDRVADLLQALDEGRSGDRTEEQYHESLRNVGLLLAGRPLESVAVEALHRRERRRDAARRVASASEGSLSDGLAFFRPESEIDGAFFRALEPGASVIMLAIASSVTPGRWIVKLRLGDAAPEGLTLHTLGIGEWDPGFGGRWNAGSNKRDGGTEMDPEEYAARLRARLLAFRPG
jgi:hypothetical protein